MRKNGRKTSLLHVQCKQLSFIEGHLDKRHLLLFGEPGGLIDEPVAGESVAEDGEGGALGGKGTAFGGEALGLDNHEVGVLTEGNLGGDVGKKVVEKTAFGFVGRGKFLCDFSGKGGKELGVVVPAASVGEFARGHPSVGETVKVVVDVAVEGLGNV